jgi:hypothetical protein
MLPALCHMCLWHMPRNSWWHPILSQLLELCGVHVLQIHWDSAAIHLLLQHDLPLLSQSLLLLMLLLLLLLKRQYGWI